MRTFLKANVAAIVASTCDYAFTFLMVEFAGIDPVLASIGGTITGGIINFIICRYWAFKVTGTAMVQQGKKYLITWAGNLLLNAAGVYVLINYAGVEYMFAKVLTSLTVAWAYNYPLQKKYVFKSIQ